MLFWFVDNIATVLALLCAVALCFGVAWWITRQNKMLIWLALPAGLMVLAGLMAAFVDTDRKQLVRNIESMRDLVNTNKLGGLIEYFADEVEVDTTGGLQSINKAQLEILASRNQKSCGLHQIVVHRIEVESVARPGAKVTFLIGPEDVAVRGLCTMEFVLSPDGKWRVRKIGVVSYPGGQKSDNLIFF